MSVFSNNLKLYVTPLEDRTCPALIPTATSVGVPLPPPPPPVTTTPVVVKPIPVFPGGLNGGQATTTV